MFRDAKWKVLRALFGRLARIRSLFRTILVLKLQSTNAGRGCSLAAGVRLRATDGGEIALGDQVKIDRFADLTAKHGSLRIGPRTYVGQFSVICAREEITIGADCLIAEHVSIRDQDHDFSGAGPTSRNGFVTEPVRIGKNVWLGAKVTVLKGVTIGDNVVVGANSVVTSDLPDNIVVVGVPAQVLRQLRCDGAK